MAHLEDVAQLLPAHKGGLAVALLGGGRQVLELRHHLSVRVMCVCVCVCV